MDPTRLYLCNGEEMLTFGKGADSIYDMWAKDVKRFTYFYFK